MWHDNYYLQIELIQMAGYPAETHVVVTDDCYILEMHRIPHGCETNESTATNAGNSRPAVLLQHGLLGHSGNWVLSWSKPTESLGMVIP